MDELHRRLVRRLRAVAKEHGVSISHVADLAGVSRSHFYDVMAGTKSPTLAWLAKVAAALEVDVEELVRRTPK